MPSTYLDSYNPIIYPIAGEDDWEQIDYPIAPPPYKKQVGRPRMKRIREPDEKKPPPAPNTTRMPRTYVKMTCQGEGSSNGGQATRKRVRKQQAKRTQVPKQSSNLKDQIIKSRKTWKKRKAMEGSQGVKKKASTSEYVQQPPTQIGHQQASQSAQQVPTTYLKQPSSNYMQLSQISSEWAGF
ncbi:hypothetical protein M0R45_035736 [Rubus argutus]|uniref:Uncharacterized protein n=1 Tax=Rubus argutus TaxID=59490 RepID=A0AAW1VVI7_RUBAR